MEIWKPQPLNSCHLLFSPTRTNTGEKLLAFWQPDWYIEAQLKIWIESCGAKTNVLVWSFHSRRLGRLSHNHNIDLHLNNAQMNWKKRHKGDLGWKEVLITCALDPSSSMSALRKACRWIRNLPRASLDAPELSLHPLVGTTQANTAARRPDFVRITPAGFDFSRQRRGRGGPWCKWSGGSVKRARPSSSTSHQMVPKLAFFFFLPSGNETSDFSLFPAEIWLLGCKGQRLISWNKCCIWKNLDFSHLWLDYSCRLQQELAGLSTSFWQGCLELTSDFWCVLLEAWRCVNPNVASQQHILPCRWESFVMVMLFLYRW